MAMTTWTTWTCGLVSALLLAAQWACSADSGGNGRADSGGDAADQGGDGAADAIVDFGLDAVPADASGDSSGDASADGDLAADLPSDGSDSDASTGCVDHYTSNLDGVTIRIDTSRCTWTLAEVAQGVDFDYDVVVDAAVDHVRPLPLDAGRCGQPDDSGLIVFGSVGGGDQAYCICDTGLCPGTPIPLETLQAGTTPGHFHWDGRNFQGPSDTGNQPGDPFPAGSYTLVLRAQGERVEGDQTTPFSIQASMDITLTP